MGVIGLCDTETTGLPLPMGIDLVYQPYLTEVFLAVMDEETFEIIDSYHSMVKPWDSENNRPIPIPDYITRITGITDLDVMEAPTADIILKELEEVWFPPLEMLVMQNFMFDELMFKIEAERKGMEIHVPPPFCMVEQTLFFKGRRMKQVELYEMAFGGEYNAHRAEEDVRAMARLYKWLRKNYLRGPYGKAYIQT